MICIVDSMAFFCFGVKIRAVWNNKMLLVSFIIYRGLAAQMQQDRDFCVTYFESEEKQYIW